MTQKIKLLSLNYSETFKVNVLNTLLAILCAIILYFDFIQRDTAGNREVLGKVIIKTKDAQRKYSDGVSWESLETEYKIYNFDKVKTDSLSQVKVLMKDNTEIMIEENSMVVFRKSKKNLDIDFMKGNVRLNTEKADWKTKKSLRIQAGGKTIGLEQDSIDLSINKQGSETSLNVNQGKISVTDSKGGKNFVSGNEVARISDGEISKFTRNIRLISPANFAYLATHSDTKLVTFEWQGSGSKTVTLEISHILSSNVKTKTYKVKGEAYAVSLPHGKFSWHVYSEKAEEKNTEKRIFYLVDDNPVQTYTPEDTAQFLYSSTPPKVSFSWSLKEFVSNYRLEIAEDKEFNRIIKESNTENQSVTIDTLKQGRYYYRIKTKSPIANSLEKVSEVKSFTITKSTEPLPPILLSPENNGNFQYAESNSPVIDFSWKGYPEFSEYILEISTDKEFTGIIKKLTSKAQIARLQDPIPAGSYYWRVKAKIKGFTKDITSDIRIFTIKQVFEKDLQLISPKDDASFPEGMVTFSWKEDSAAKDYILELSKRADFSIIINSVQSEKNKVSTNLQTGIYYWRVSYNSLKGGTISSKNYHRIRIESGPGPRILKPAPGQGIDMSTKDKIEFEWDFPKSKARFYRIQLIRSAEGMPIFTYDNIQNTKYTLANLNILKSGSYIFMVEAKLSGKEYEENYSKPGRINFYIYLSKKVSKEQLKFITPENVYK